MLALRALLSPLGYTENRLRRGKARHSVLAQRAELSWTVTGKLRRSDDRLAELGSDFLQTRRQIHRRADASKVEPVTAADIAVHHFADVQGKTEADGIGVVGARQLGNATAKRPRAFQRASADRAGVLSAVDRENREQPVAHEF